MLRPISGLGSFAGGCLRTVPDPALASPRPVGNPGPMGVGITLGPHGWTIQRPWVPFSLSHHLGCYLGQGGMQGETSQAEGLGGCSAPGLSPLPIPTPPTTTWPGCLKQCEGELQRLWSRGRKSYKNIIAPHAETACLGVAFLDRCERFPTPASLHSAEVLSPRAPQRPGQDSGRVPWGRHCLNRGAAAKP